MYISYVYTCVYIYIYTYIHITLYTHIYNTHQEYFPIMVPNICIQGLAEHLHPKHNTLNTNSNYGITIITLIILIMALTHIIISIIMHNNNNNNINNNNNTNNNNTNNNNTDNNHNNNNNGLGSDFPPFRRPPGRGRTSSTSTPSW